jgi:hypothetical protein
MKQRLEATNKRLRRSHKKRREYLPISLHPLILQSRQAENYVKDAAITMKGQTTSPPPPAATLRREPELPLPCPAVVRSAAHIR